MLALSCLYGCLPAAAWAGMANMSNGQVASAAPQPSTTASPEASGSQDDIQRALAPLKAEYLYRFLGYVDFPKGVLPQPDSPLVIGVTGADEVYEALADTLASRAIGSRLVLRRRLSVGDSLAGVHLLFAGHTVDLTQSALVKAARAIPVLLVTESPDGLNAGSIFNFLLVGDQLRFEASVQAADRASLKVSSRVLALAERVVGGH